MFNCSNCPHANGINETKNAVGSIRVGVERQRKTKLVQTGEPQNGTVLETLRSHPGMLQASELAL